MTQDRKTGKQGQGAKRVDASKGAKGKAESRKPAPVASTEKPAVLTGSTVGAVREGTWPAKCLDALAGTSAKAALTANEVCDRIKLAHEIGAHGLLRKLHAKGLVNVKEDKERGKIYWCVQHRATRWTV